MYLNYDFLKKFKWYPELLYTCDTNNMLCFKNVGKPLRNKYKPHDLKEQFNQILNDLESVNVQNNDIKNSELLMDSNKKIYLCNFGWGSINNDLGCCINIYSCNNKKKRVVILMIKQLLLD